MSATEKLINLISGIAKLGYSLGLGLAVLCLIIIGLKYTKAGGKDVSKIHSEIVLLLIGIILIIVSFAIPTIIISFIEK